MDQRTDGLFDKTQLDRLQDDWSLIEFVLPDGWKEKARELKALFIPKEFKDPGALL